MNSLFALEDKRVLVVGGGQGMGEATSRLLAGLGCHVAVMDLESDRAERVCAELRGLGVEAMPVVANVLDDGQLVDAIARVEREFGPLYGMVSIIGMAGWAPLIDMTAETWDMDHQRNLRYFFVAAREVARSLLARGAPGSIVCVASVDGLRSARNHGSYGAAKAGLVNLVKTMASEWSGQGIRVNCVAPGAIVTPRLPLGPEELEREAMANVPMGRRGSTNEIGKAVTFFLSDLASYVTGQTLAVDGGYLAAGGFGMSNQKVPLQGTMGVDNAKP